MDDKPELTWYRICQQVGKKRIDRTPRTYFGRLLESSKPMENSEIIPGIIVGSWLKFQRANINKLDASKRTLFAKL